MVKKIFKILLWLILLGSSLILLSFVSGKYDQIVLRKISIDFNINHTHDFITKKFNKEFSKTKSIVFIKEIFMTMKI